MRGVPDYLLAEYIKKALCALSRTSQLKQKLQKMKLILVLLVVATASASSQADFYGDIPSLQGILCQLHLGDIPLCPASSCKEIADTRPGDSRSGLHWLTNGDTVFQARCDHGIPPSQSRGWMQVGNITSDSGCPAGLEQLTAGGRKLCRKTVETGCSTVNFSTDGVSYSKVCGRVFGYQKDTPDAFHRLGVCTTDCTIDQAYIDGVSITRGSPRQHIWTLAATKFVTSCPCGTGSTVTVPSFVGTDYFCDVSGFNTYSSADVLWDGQGCLAGAEQCCEKANWFCKDLPQTTTGDIEFRLCTDQSRADEDVYIEDVEIYVQ